MESGLNPQIIQLFTIDTLWLIVKFGFLLAFAVYIVFAIVVVVQIRQMVDTLNGQIDGILKAIGLVHLLLAIGAFVLALVLL